MKGRTSTAGDRILIATVAVAALVAWPLLAGASGSDSTAQISGPHGETRVDLTVDQVLTVDGSAGDLTVEVLDRTIRVTHADCPDGVCVRTGRVSALGSLIACVPNRVVITVGAEGDSGYDARVR